MALCREKIFGLWQFDFPSTLNCWLHFGLMTKNGNICGILHTILIQIWSWKCQWFKKKMTHFSWITSHLLHHLLKNNSHSSIHQFIFVLFLSLTMFFFWPKMFRSKMFSPVTRSPSRHLGWHVRHHALCRLHHLGRKHDEGQHLPKKQTKQLGGRLIQTVTGFFLSRKFLDVL